MDASLIPFPYPFANVPDYFAMFCGFALFLCMLALMELGARAWRRRPAREPDAGRVGSAASEAAVFALLGLLIAFTFSGAAQRFDERRALIVSESNAIGTAWLCLDVLPEPARGALRADFRSYVDARLATFSDPTGFKPNAVALTRVAQLQAEIWVKAAAACRGEGNSAAMLVLPSLNEVFDIAPSKWPPCACIRPSSFLVC